MESEGLSPDAPCAVETEAFVALAERLDPPTRQRLTELMLSVQLLEACGDDAGVERLLATALQTVSNGSSADLPIAV
jgi:hypothetical protein